jgi:signal recognition particle receptor subunit beta
MVLFNHATREMTAKIVYYGPGLCGKTTNLLVIFDKLDEKNRGKMLSLATKTDRTLFFDLLPVDIGKVGPFNLKIQLYTVPGQVFYNETRKLVLKGADAVVFVADSQPSMVESNRESFANLLENLTVNNIDPNGIPIVIQYNKRDIPGVLPVDELQERLSLDGYPYMEASALRGDGVMETFKLVSKIAAKHLINKLQGKPAAKPEVSRPGKAKRPSAAPVAAPKPPTIAELGEETIALTDNPFAASMPSEASFDAPALDAAPPFESAALVDESYETVEEVSLEQLLEGRERPATIAGSVPVPVVLDDVEPLPEDSIVPEEAEDVAVAVEESTDETPYPAALATGANYEELINEIAGLKREIAQLRSEHDRFLEKISRAFGEIAELARR